MTEIFQSEHYLKEVLPMLDMVDDLRALLGNEEGIKLPSIAVIGSQSAGKSTVIERLSGIQLPRGTGMVTKCPLIMRLRTKSPNEKASQQQLSESLTSPPFSLRIGRDLEKLEETDQATISQDVERLTKQIMDQASERVKKFGVSPTPIHVEVTHPSLKDLTLIDLPDIFSVDVKSNLPIEGIQDYIKEIYHTYIKSPECLIVCVLPAHTDLGVQLARGWATELDPKGVRSIGVLTQVDRGPTKETYDRILDIGTVNAARFPLGVIALRNPSHSSTPAKQALEDEKHFFQKFAADLNLDPLPSRSCGLEALMSQLVHLQAQKISDLRPKLRADVTALLESKQAELSKLPPPLRDANDAKNLSIQYFLALSNSLRDLYEVSVKGDIAGQQIDPRLLFQPRTFEMCEAFEKGLTKAQSAIFCSEFMAKVRELHKNTRGRDLVDLSINHVFPTLVAQEFELMRAPALELVENFSTIMMAAVEAAVQLHIGTIPELAIESINALQEMMRESKAKCLQRIAELIKIECEQTFTLSHYYTESVTMLSDLAVFSELASVCAKAKSKRHNDEVVVQAASAPKVQRSTVLTMASVPAVVAPVASVEDNESTAILELLVKLYSYRKVVQKRFVDGVAVFCRYQFSTLLKDSALDVLVKHFSPDELLDLMKEDSILRAKRANLEKSISRLEKARERIRQAHPLHHQQQSSSKGSKQP